VLSMVEFMPVVILGLVAVMTGLGRGGALEVCRGRRAAEAVIAKCGEPMGTGGTAAVASMPNKPNFRPFWPENGDRHGKQSQFGAELARSGRSRSPEPKYEARNPRATPCLKMTVRKDAPAHGSGTMRVKQTQYRRFWPENVGPIEKQSQSVGSGALRRAVFRRGRDAMGIHDGILRGRELGAGRGKQSQFPASWAKNGDRPEKQSQFAPEGGQSPLTPGPAAYQGGTRRDGIAAPRACVSFFGLDAALSANRLAGVDAQRCVCRFGQVRGWPIHRISKRRRSCP